MSEIEKKERAYLEKANIFLNDRQWDESLKWLEKIKALLYKNDLPSKELAYKMVRCYRHHKVFSLLISWIKN